LAASAAVVGVLLAGGGIALILGVVSLLRLRTSGKRGRGLAITGIVLTVAWAGFGVAAYVDVLSKPPARNADGVLLRKTDLPTNQLRIGDCIEKFAATKEVDKVTAVPCTTAHDAEVFHTFELAGTEYPGDSTVKQQSSSTCLTSKTTIKPADVANAKIAVFKPLATSWTAGNHRVTCVAVQNSGTITRSIRK
jgi:hypothetical protein